MSNTVRMTAGESLWSGLDNGLQVLALQMMKGNLPRRTTVSKKIQTEDDYKTLELKMTSTAIPAFRTDHFNVYKSREANRTVKI